MTSRRLKRKESKESRLKKPGLGIPNCGQAEVVGAIPIASDIDMEAGRAKATNNDVAPSGADIGTPHVQVFE